MRAQGAGSWWKTRLVASLWDYVVILGILAGAAIVGAGLTWSGSARPTDLGWVDGVSFWLTVAPTWVYLTLTEGGRRYGTWGKRRVGLRVTGADGAAPGWVRVALRNAIKLLPWHLGHLGTVRLALLHDPPPSAYILEVVSGFLVVATLVLAWRTPRHRALHDLAAGTVVTPAHSAE